MHCTSQSPFLLLSRSYPSISFFDCVWKRKQEGVSIHEMKTTNALVLKVLRLSVYFTAISVFNELQNRSWYKMFFLIQPQANNQSHPHKQQQCILQQTKNSLLASNASPLNLFVLLLISSTLGISPPPSGPNNRPSVR